MYKTLFLLFILIVSSGQEHPAKPATLEINKACDYWTQQKLPIIMNPESKLIDVKCGNGGFIFDIMLYTYESNESINLKVLDRKSVV